MQQQLIFLLLCVTASVPALQLASSRVVVQVDELFPRALNYTLLATGETIQAAVTGWGFGLSISVNDGQVTCGESGLATVFSAVTPAAAQFTVNATCVQHFPGPFAVVLLTLTGTVAVADDAAVEGAGLFRWTLQSAELSAPSSVVDVILLHFAGLEALSFRPLESPGCMYTPTDNGQVPACGGDAYLVDSWSNIAQDEWATGTWSSTVVQGAVDMNTPPGANPSCLYGAASRHAAGPMLSVLAGGWSASGRTGAAVLSTELHAPFWTGLRSHETPGRCTVFTVAPAPVHARLVCGSGLPFALTVGVFPDVTEDARVDSDDVYLWRRMQYARADVLYRTTLPYKLLFDDGAYDAGWVHVAFTDLLSTVFEPIGRLTDGYPQTPILVGWQGLGHDTVYPGWDIPNIRPVTGGLAGIQAVARGLAAASGSNRSSLSYHVNADEAYSQFNGSANAEWEAGMCHLNVDRQSIWAMNCTTVHFQTPDCGLRCSISKSKDATFFGRYTRYGRFFQTVPPGLRTIHSDAWREAGVSWEPLSAAPAGVLNGYIDFENEQRCGQQADSAFWAAHGASMGVEGNDGQSAELMGVVSFLYHTDGSWTPYSWGRIVSGTTLNWDLDVNCANSGWNCGWDNWANRFYMSARIYQLALTDELLGTTADGDGGHRVHRFRGGGRVLAAHTTASAAWLTTGRSGRSNDLPHPSTWPFGGDSIPIVDDLGGVLLPLVAPDGETLEPSVLHAYQFALPNASDPSCPLFSDYRGSDNTAFANWNGPGIIRQFEQDPTLPLETVVGVCNATCWANASCAGWAIIKPGGTSGKTKPLCSIYSTVAGCQADVNQFSGARAVLPLPPAHITQRWTLPLSWVGRAITATSLTPSGPQPGPQFTLDGNRSLTLHAMTPGLPVRLQVD